MHITKHFLCKSVWSVVLVSLSHLSFAADQTVAVEVAEQQSSTDNIHVHQNHITTTTDTVDHQKHLREHGGQVYQTTTLQNEWLVNEEGQGTLGSKIQSLIGTDENRLFIEANLNKSESHDPQYDVSALYSRNIATYWDAQAGLRYREDQNNPDHGRVDGVIGVLGLAPYFFETQAYLYGGEDNFWGASLEVERDFLLTQKLITQPYIEMDIVFNDDSQYASKTGLSELKTGIKTRYEMNKRIRPFIDIGYQYEKGVKQTTVQQATDSEKGWLYGAGLELRF